MSPTAVRFQRSSARRSRSEVTSKARHANLGAALLEERGDALARLAVLEQPLLLPALAGQALAQREVVGDVDRAHHGVQRGLRERAQLARERQRVALGVVDEAVDQPHVQRFLGRRPRGR